MVVNPVKLDDAAEFKAVVCAAMTEHGWGEPIPAGNTHDHGWPGASPEMNLHCRAGRVWCDR